MEKESRVLLDNSVSILQSAIERFRPNCPGVYKKAILTLYENTNGLLDKNFLDQIQVDFPSRLAELVFSCL